MYPFLTQSSRRDLREILYKSYIMRGDNNNETDNKEVLRQILQNQEHKSLSLTIVIHTSLCSEERML